MDMVYGYTMIDQDTAICPLPGADHDWEVSGLDGDTAMFELPDGGTRNLTLPFYDGGVCSAVRHTVLQSDGSTPVVFWLLIPDQAGNRRIEVSIQKDRNLWFAVATLSPRKMP